MEVLNYSILKTAIFITRSQQSENVISLVKFIFNFLVFICNHGCMSDDQKQGVNTPLLLRKDSLSYDSYGIQQYPSGSLFNCASLKLDRAE